MNGLSQHFRHLEQRLGEAELEEAAAVAGEMHGLLVHPVPLLALAPPPLEDIFEAAITRLDRASGELAELATKGNLLGAGQAFEELRASCVSCHVRFRSGNDLRGLYPARDNTITGKLEVRDVDGEPRENRGWVLVFLEGPPPVLPFTYARSNPRVSQIGRRFDPRVLPVIVGTEVEFPNDDTIFHNVFSLSKTAPFDLGAYEPGQSTSVRMQRTGLVKVYCNIHPDMAASIVVLDGPWFALSDRTGRFVICGVPDGEYVLRAWNDMGAEGRAPIEARGGALLETNLELRETRRSLAHDNKHGVPYSTRGYR